MPEVRQLGNLIEQLQQLLAESPSAANHRASGWLREQGATPRRPWILHGAGQLGRRVREHLLETKQRVLAVTDGDPTRWGTQSGGFRIQPPQEALAQWGDEAAVLVTIGNAQHDFRETRNNLQQATKAPVLPVHGYFWRFPHAFLPFYSFDLPGTFLAARERVLEAAGIFDDLGSLAQFVGQLKWRILLEADALPIAIPETQYFPSDLVPEHLEGLFVDCGAFDGDTLRALLAHTGSAPPPVVAYEPDPRNHARLLDWHGTLAAGIRKGIDCRAKAVGAVPGMVTFSNTGSSGARITTVGTAKVPVVRLDEDLAGQEIGFLKMDLEGFEREALQGAARLLGKAGQFAAICIYHRPEDFWEIPALLAAHFPHHRFFVRTHGQDGFDVVLYAIPIPHATRRPR